MREKDLRGSDRKRQAGLKPWSPKPLAPCTRSLDRRRRTISLQRVVARENQYGNLHENKIFEYAQSHKLDEAMVGLSLLCSLPVDVIERALIDTSGEVLLILAKALGFSWETAMSLLFLCAPDHRIAREIWMT